MITPQTPVAPATTPSSSTWTTSGFAGAIRAKYPHGIASDGKPYVGLSDQELTSRFVAKYPVYQSQISDYGQKAKGPSEPSLGELTGNEQVAGAKQAVHGVEEGAQIQNESDTSAGGEVEKAGGVLHAGAQSVIGAGRSLFAPITASIQEVINKSSDNPVVQAAANSGPVKAFLDAANAGGAGVGAAWDAVEKAHPAFARIVSDSAGVAATAAGAEGVKVPEVGAIKDAVSDAAQGVKSGVKAVTNKVPKIGGTPTAGKILDSATERVRPDYGAMTVKQREAAINQKVYTKGPNGKVTTSPRVASGGKIKGRSINLTDSEKAAATDVSKLPDYTPDMSHLDTHTLINEGIEKEAVNLESSLDKEGQAIPRKQIVSTVSKAINKVPGESLILQKSDPVIKKYISSVKNAAEKVDGTLKGAYQIRKSMDKAYKQAGKDYPVGDDRRGALDEVHRASRNALYDFLVKNAKNTDVAASLAKQKNLYNASDAVLPKAAREAGSSLEKIQRFVKNHSGRIGLGAGLLGGSALVEGGRKLLGD